MTRKSRRNDKGYLADMPGSRWRDVGGMRFGKLRVVEPLGEKRHGQHLWLCKCDCGKYKILPIGQLHEKTHGTKSCGCLLGRQPVHGMGRTKIHARWMGIIRRCEDPRSTSYKYYGAKGVTVCERWHQFALFYEDMGDPPFEGAQIDRIDPDKGYSPENCQWLSLIDNVKKAARDTRLRKAKLKQATCRAQPTLPDSNF